MNQVQTALESLEQMSTKHDYDNMARFGITASKAFGVSVGNIRKLAKELGRSHELAAELWETGWYEARMLSAFVDEPARVTPTQMDRWCRDFDNWGICDTLCFHLFDRTPHAWKKIEQWSDKRAEFMKRGSFALLASVALHDKKTGDEPFLESLPLIERAATDERNFVKKGVSWALRSVGRRNAALRKASIALSRRLVDSPDAAARWIGRDALKDLTKKS
jgi:3-methyladenine DNA glycosylase AlkD